MFAKAINTKQSANKLLFLQLNLPIQLKQNNGHTLTLYHRKALAVFSNDGHWKNISLSY